MHMRRLGSQRGETIVEVLIALAVTSFLIGAAYATANRSLMGARQSQERAEALTFTESQVEALRFLVTDVGFTGGSATRFCLVPDAVLPALKIVTLPAGTPAATPNGDNLSSSPYPAVCQKGLGIKYHLSITRSAGTMHEFVIRARWQKAGGGENQEVAIRYTVF